MNKVHCYRSSSNAQAVTILVLHLLLGGCEGRDEREPLDGGYPLETQRMDLDTEKMLASDPCWRKEHGGWHLSAGHCSEMLPPQKMAGVWVTGFEESSFFPDATSIPDRNDPRRYMINLEIDNERIATLVGRDIEDSEYHAIALTLVARRTKYPSSIGCDGRRAFSIVAYRIVDARYLGTVGNPDRPTRSIARYEPFKRSGEGGVVGRMEDEALALCRGRAEP